VVLLNLKNCGLKARVGAPRKRGEKKKNGGERRAHLGIGKDPGGLRESRRITSEEGIRERARVAPGVQGDVRGGM